LAAPSSPESQPSPMRNEAACSGGVTVVVSEDVCVDLKEAADVGVADSITHDLRADPCLERTRGVGVPKVVEGDPGEAGGRGEAVETLPDGVGVRWTTVLKGEHITPGVIVATKDLALAVLDGPPGA
jgi:hypothetical protein